MVLKPSEKVPFTMTKVVELLKEAGLPDGVVNLVNGTAERKGRGIMQGTNVRLNWAPLGTF
jgi:acyl-CoA reductase-like NAD-dependent aldehyde dehydrogenase